MDRRRYRREVAADPTHLGAGIGFPALLHIWGQNLVRHPHLHCVVSADVQATTVLLMNIEGGLPRLDHAVFADTGWEPAAVYRHMEWLSRVAEAHGIRVHRVSAGDLRRDVLTKQKTLRRGRESRFASMPLHARQGDGTVCMIRRQCTREYKIEPIELFIRSELLGLRPRQKYRGERPAVRQWYGISWDEWGRIRRPSRRWAVNFYPLIRLGRDVMREAIQHSWDEALQVECGWDDDGESMLQLALREPDQARQR